MSTESSCKVAVILVRFYESRIFWTYFQKILKFHKNASGGSRVVPCGRTGARTDGLTDRQT